MSFQLPVYHAPDFSHLTGAPDARFAPAPKDGVAPVGFHSTSMYPEYFKIGGKWTLAPESRMDCSVVLRSDGTLDVVENRRLRAGDRVVIGRTECGEDGIYLHASGFEPEKAASGDQFAFRQGRSRETSYARDYDRLVELLRHEREHGHILWVMGPAFAFDEGARAAMQKLIENGYCHGLLAGNALGTHDLEAALLHTALGQDIYTQQSQPNGHYNHLDVLNLVRASGSIPQFIADHHIDNGILYACVRQNVPFVLTSSIRDDGRCPRSWRTLMRGRMPCAHRSGRRRPSSASPQCSTPSQPGNMTPSFRVLPDGTVRPVYLYAVDAAEFVVNKLLDRGSLAATTMVTNVQDFIGKVTAGLGL